MDDNEIKYIAAKLHDEIDQKFKDRIVVEIERYDGNPDPKQVSILVYNTAAALKDYMYELIVKFAQELNKKD